MLESIRFFALLPLRRALNVFEWQKDTYMPFRKDNKMLCREILNCFIERRNNAFSSYTLVLKGLKTLLFAL